MPDEDLTRVIARRLGVPAPDEDLLAAIDDAIEDAEADVVGYLGRPITPQQYTAHGLWPNPFTGWALPETPVLSIVSTTAERWPEDNSLTGTFTVVYTAGLDYRNDPALSPIRRYVRAAAQNAPTLIDHLVASGRRGPISSVSVSTDGQSKSITYSQQTNTGGGGGAAGSDSPGALPSKTTLDKWRLANRRVHQARTPR